MSDTETLIKEPIRRLIAERFCDVLTSPTGGDAREFTLRLPDGQTFRADWAFAVPSGGWLFIEDDDAARSLHNLTKYWMWLDATGQEGRVDLIHLVGPGQHAITEFTARMAEAAHPAFHYHLVEVPAWSDTAWITELAATLERILHSGGDGVAPIPSGEKAFVGMWHDREDLVDSAGWVRARRRREWPRHA